MLHLTLAHAGQQSPKYTGTKQQAAVCHSCTEVAEADQIDSLASKSVKRPAEPTDLVRTPSLECFSS